MYIKPDNLNHCTLACQQQLVSSITSEKETKKKKKNPNYKFISRSSASSRV